MLEHEADIALAARLRDEASVAVEQHLPVIRPFESGDDAQQRGLARAGRAEQRDQLAGADVEIDVVRAPRNRRIAW